MRKKRPTTTTTTISSAPKSDAPPEKAPALDKLAGEYEGAVASDTPAPETAAQPGAVSGEPKRRGRPPGSKGRVTSPTSEFLVMRPMVKAVIAFPYSIAAQRYGPHWLLDEAELERMVDPHLALINKYLPEYVKENSELYAVLMLHALAIVIRVSIQATLNAQAQAQAEGAVTGNVSGVDGVGETGVGKIFSAPRPA